MSSAKKTFRFLLILFATLFALVLIGLWIFGIPEGFQVLRLLNSYLDKESFAADLTLYSPDGRSVSAECIVQKWIDDPVIGIRKDNTALYLWDETLCFDSLRCFDVSELMEPLPDLERKDLLLLLLGGFSRKQTGNDVVYTMRLKEGAIPGLSISITSQAEEIRNIILTLDSGWRLEAVPVNTGYAPVPTETLMALGGKAEPIEPFLPLLKGCLALAKRQMLEFDMEIDAKCATIPIRDHGRLILDESGAFLVRDNKQIPLSLPDTAQSENLVFALGWELMRNGSAMATDLTTVEYTLVFPSGIPEALIIELVPQLDGLGIHFAEGTLRLSVRHNAITDARFECDASIPVLITNLPLQLQIAWTVLPDTE